MSQTLLNFRAADTQERPIKQLSEYFNLFGHAYIDEKAKDEIQARYLALDLLQGGFEKCIFCKAEGRSVDLVLIEHCPNDKCPLYGLYPKIAGAIMMLIGDSGEA
jgi:hypothetical protein